MVMKKGYHNVKHVPPASIQIMLALKYVVHVILESSLRILVVCLVLAVQLVTFKKIRVRIIVKFVNLVKDRRNLIQKRVNPVK
jgi:hypothetical protein